MEHHYRKAAVASDVSVCSTVGKDILLKGGNAMDAAIASLLCMGITDPHSMGIGGGFILTYYDRKSQTAFVVDARETAPELANTIYEQNPDAFLTERLSIAVPGEIKGYWLAHQKFGRLPWKDLFIPAIKMAELGFAVPESLARVLHENERFIHNEPSLQEIFLNHSTNKLYKTGEIMKVPTFANTLKKIANGGQDVFYGSGELRDDILNDLKDIGSIITSRDLENYKALIKKPITTVLKGGFKVFSPPLPGGGIILSLILNVLDGYNMAASDFNGPQHTVRALHRIVETFKFANANRTHLADEDFVDMSEFSTKFISQEFANHIRSQISDDKTHDSAFYGSAFHTRVNTGTAHLSIVDADGNAVSATSTINSRFGCLRRGVRTGIIFNNEMDDFASPGGITCDRCLAESPANHIQSGKRPLSAMCPAVIVMPNGDVRMVIGAAGGPRITMAIAYVIVRHLWLGETLDKAVNALRLHHYFLPDAVCYEDGFDEELLLGLKKLGHKLKKISARSSVVQAIARQNDFLVAACDKRKGGNPDGY